MEYLIQLGINGLKRVLEKQEFTTSEKVEKEIDDFAVSNNPVLGFFRENDRDDIAGHVTKDVYIRYQLFCHDNGHNPISAGELSKQIKKYYDLDIINKSVNGKKARVFKK